MASLYLFLAVSAFFLGATASSGSLQTRLNNGLAITPPMGYVKFQSWYKLTNTFADGIPTITIPALQTNPSYIRTRKLW